MPKGGGGALEENLDTGPALTEAEIRVRQAAVLLFAHRGYAATGIRDIARAAGITSATLYHYTASKEDLLVQIMVTGQRLLTRNARQALEGVDRPEERLAILVANLVGAHATNPMTTIVVDTEVRALRAGSAEQNLVIGLRDEYEGLWRDTLELGAAQGVFHFTDEHLTRLGLLTMCAGMSRWYRPDGPDDPHQMIEKLTDTALGAVRASRAGRWLRSDDLPQRPPYAHISVPWEPPANLPPA